MVNPTSGRGTDNSGILGWSKAMIDRMTWVDFLIIAVAAILRFLWLGMKPAHFDEGVNGWFVDQMTSAGYYRYDPTNFHGPFHFYVLFVAQTLLGRAEWVLRFPMSLCGVACVALTIAFRRFFDARICRIAATAMAISPGMVFYSRYAIHETWQVLFLMLAAWGFMGLWRDGTRRDLWITGLAITGLILTKETYIIHL